MNQGQRGLLVSWLRHFPDRHACTAAEKDLIHQAANELEGLGRVIENIDELRAEEGDQVVIICDNPDFHARDPYNTAVDCCGEWTSWDEQRFKGDNLVDCLAKAVAARRNKKEKPQ